MRIEDIKRIKKIKKPEILEQPSESSETASESSEPAKPESQSENWSEKRQPVRYFWPKLIFAFLLILAISGCWFFSLYKVQAKINGNLKNLENDFPKFSEAIANKDIFSLGGQINDLNENTTESILALQSVGQDIYCLNLLYPEKQNSKTSTAIDTVRAAHLLTNSFARLAKSGSGNQTDDAGNYLEKLNSLMANLNGSSQKLAKNIAYANFASKEADNLIKRNNSSHFSSSEKSNFDNLAKLAETSSAFFSYLSAMPSELNNFLTFSGGKKSYLLLFHNNAEIRPGGGFIGSFAKIDLENGRISKIDFEKNIYTLDKAFLAAGNNITPPKELQALTSAWTMRDANMSADFAESAKKVAWFYNQEAAEKVDGVIAIDTTLFINLLKIVGPINMPEYNLLISDKNFLSDVQYQVEIGYFEDKANWSENQPKKILADMMPKFLNQLFAGSKNQQKINETIFSAIREKHLLFYLESDKFTDLIDGINAGGKVHQSSGDYLYLSDANLGGYKSSLEIEENVRQDVLIKNSGDVEEKVTILRKHNGSYDWPDGINNNYLKVFLPLAATVTGVEFSAGDNNPRSDPNLAGEKKYSSDLEFGKTVVGFWQNTKPGEQSQSVINFVRENAIQMDNDRFDYQITIQKQPGIEKFSWALYLVYPEGWKPQNVENYDEKNHQIFLKEEIRQDSVFRLRFSRSQD